MVGPERIARESKPLILGENSLKIGSGATPRGGKESYLQSGPISLIRSQNVHNHGFEFGGLAFIDADQAQKLQNVEVRACDVLVNITGDSVARVCMVHPAVLPARVNQHVAIVRPNPAKIDPVFLRYWLIHPRSQAHLLGLASAGATRNALTKVMLERLEIPNFRIELQKEIGAILSALDDKIELNRQMNQTLEAMARAVFLDWFVDFGPTRRKAAGETDPAAILGGLIPDSTKAAPLAALFPDSFGPNGLPLGWEVRKIDSILTRLKIGRLYDQKSAFAAGSVPILDQGKHGIIGFHNDEPNIRASKASRVAVFANHTCVQRLLDFDFSTIQNVIPFVGKDIPIEWCHYATLGKQKFEEYKGHWPTFVAREVVVPSVKLAIEFSNIIAPKLEMVSHNEQENQTLAATRDLLLPKLMSGELRLVGGRP